MSLVFSLKHHSVHVSFILPSQQTPEEELCNLLTNIIFSVTWRGVEGWDDAAWKERGQVFSVLTKLGTACELVRPPDEIKRRWVLAKHQAAGAKGVSSFRGCVGATRLVACRCPCK